MRALGPLCSVLDEDAGAASRGDNRDDSAHAHGTWNPDPLNANHLQRWYELRRESS